MPTIFSKLWQSLWVSQVVDVIDEKKKRAGLQTDTTTSIAQAVNPHIFMISDEANGKTSILRRILQYPVLPYGPGMITRLPIQVELRYSSEAVKPTWVLTLPGVAPFTSSDPLAIQAAIQKHHDHIKATCGIDPNKAILRMTSNTVPNLTLTDLPGLLAVVCEGSEPLNLAQTASAIAIEELKRPHSIAIVVREATANPRHSPTLALLAKLKPQQALHIITKCDRCMDNDWQVDSTLTGKTGPLSELFSSIPDDAICCRNWPHDRFDEMAKLEMDWFSANMSKEEKAKWGNNIGIDAVLRRLNEIAEGASRPAWKEIRERTEKENLLKLETDLTNLGPLYTSAQIANILTTQMFPKGNDSASDLFKSLWDDQKYQCPPSNIWSNGLFQGNIDLYLTALRTRIPQMAKEVFAKPDLKLGRYQAFLGELCTWWGQWIDSQKPVFTDEWTKMCQTLRTIHHVSSKIEANHWQWACMCATTEAFFFTLSPSSPARTLNFSVTLSTKLGTFSNVETDTVMKRREQLVLQIATMREVLNLL